MSRCLPFIVVALVASVAPPLPQRSTGEGQASSARSATAGRVLWKYETGG